MSAPFAVARTQSAITADAKAARIVAILAAFGRTILYAVTDLCGSMTNFFAAPLSKSL